VFATCFDLHNIIIKRTCKNSILVFELCFLIWIHIVITVFYHWIADTTLHNIYRGFLSMQTCAIGCALTSETAVNQLNGRRPDGSKFKDG
jgi:hypothetical protein